MIDFVNGVNLLPSTGEFTYDTVPYLGQRATETVLSSINRYANGGPSAGIGSTTDYSIAIDNLQAEVPGCTTVAIVIAWFGSSTDVTACKIYPSTTYINGAFQQASGVADQWRCSGLTQSSSGLIPIPRVGGSSIYGGTPSDQSVVRCIRDLKARGLRVVFYPFILMTDAGQSWRGDITFQGGDISSAATAAIDAFFGSASAAQFMPDSANLTVGYAGSPTDFTYRRMLLHYANLCVLAGGVDLFLLGSELRGLETVRGPAWTKPGTTGSDGKVTWDYPFVAGLMQLADDVRGVFDAAGLTKDLSGLHNLVAYSADWSAWMGFQHPGENGQWPHLDQLYAHTNIDVVAFDNYLPLSDMTTGNGSLDVLNWSAPAPFTMVDCSTVEDAVIVTSDIGGIADGVSAMPDCGAVTDLWPPSADKMSGLGLSSQPTIYSTDYLKANIEGGEKFNWFYANSNNDGIGLDPNGSDLRVSVPEGDRLSQSRSSYFPGQQLLANKQLRWWWNNSHQAIYDSGDGYGFAPHGPNTEWVPQSKSIIFAEYGFAAVDRATNQPNVFFGPNSSQSATPYWSIWDPDEGGGYRPREDDEIQLLALQALYEYWFVDGHNTQSLTGLPMIEPAFCAVWNWDARPFPTFPALTAVWGDAGNWRTGQWFAGKGPQVTPPVPDPPPAPGAFPPFPTLSGKGWSVHYRPDFSTGIAQHASGRESRTSKMSMPLMEIELTFDVLSMDDLTRDFQTLAGFFSAMQGQGGVFTFPVPEGLNFGATLICRFEDDSEDLEEFMNRLWTLQSLKLRTVK